MLPSRTFLLGMPLLKDQVYSKPRRGSPQYTTFPEQKVSRVIKSHHQ